MMTELQAELNQVNNLQATENGALGYSTTGNALVDLNFRVAGLRKGVTPNDYAIFMQAMRDNLVYAVKWLFYLRDVRGGMGERDTFTKFFSLFYTTHKADAIKTIHLIAEFGRWKDLFDIAFATNDTELRQAIFAVVGAQLRQDVEDLTNGKSISLLAKWMPSINATDKARKQAVEVCKYLGMYHSEYRKMLSKLRKALDVTEVKTCGNDWQEIDYNKVSSNANLRYKEAFKKHDGERYAAHINAALNVETASEVKVHASNLYPYEIWNKYCANGRGHWGRVTVSQDNSLEAMWKNLTDLTNGGNTMVVCDGSGSMTTTIGSGSVRAIDVSRSLSVYFAERCTGEFKDQFIEFSSRPQFIDLRGLKTLVDKINHVSKYDDCSNTDIEAVFNLILRTAVNGNMKQSDLPDRILIVSDMEFDAATTYIRWNGSVMDHYKTLFETLADRYRQHGYTLPKLVFWNVNSRTNTIPVTQNEAGVILVSGFSVNTAKMVMSGQADPWLALKETLDNERYNVIGEVLA